MPAALCRAEPGYLRVCDRLVALCAQRPRLTYKEIAHELDVPLGSIGNYIRTAIADGLVAPRYRTGAPVPPTAQQQVWLDEIEARRSKGETWKVIGANFGVTKQAIHQFYARQSGGAL